MTSMADYPKALKLVQEGNVADFVELVNSFDNVKHINTIKHQKSGDNAAIVAARYGRTTILEILDRNGMDLEQWNKDGKRPLHEAAYAANLDCVKFLIDVGVEVDCLKRADWTPLMLACTKSNIEIIEILVQAGASIVQCNKDGWDSFHVAAREGHVDILGFLLDKLKISGNWSNTKCSKNGRSPLHTAAFHGKEEAVRFMVDNCGYASDAPDSCGATPLMDALRCGHITLAEYLITHHKASIYAYDKLSHQPIHLTAQTGCKESLNYLITKHRVDPQTKTTKTEMTPLHFAAKEGHVDVIEYLAQKGVDINSKDNNGRTGIKEPTFIPIDIRRLLNSTIIMKLKILLLFIVGFIALAGAVPLETPEEDAKLEPAVEDLGKEDAEEMPAPEQNDSEQEEDANEADEAQDTSEEEEADENEKEDEPVNDDEEPESDVTENEQDAEKRGRRLRCKIRSGVFVCLIRRFKCHRGRKRLCSKKHCFRHPYRSRVCYRCKNVCHPCRRTRGRCHWYTKHLCHGRQYARVCLLKHIYVCPLRCTCHRVCWWHKIVRRHRHHG